MDSNPAGNGGDRLPPPKVQGYKLDHLIGKGSYGHVFRATKTDTKEVVAIKCVPLKSLSNNSRENIINEIAILKKLKHPFIVHMLDFQWDKAFVYMIFEFCTGGELASIIRLKRAFPEEIVQHFLQQLASAMKYLRDNNIAHLDLKPQNILITGIQFVSLLNGLNSFNVWRHVILKIADFGFSHYLSDDERMTSLRGSPLYMAPEVMIRKKYDARADLWSIGIILFECLFGKTPLHGLNTAEITQLFLDNEFKLNLSARKLSDGCYDLLKRLLQVDPKKRISFENFFNHPFIDLEHMPCAESFKKAMTFIRKAAEEESKGLLKTAFYNLREALLYLMPLYQWGIPDKPVIAKKQEELKTMIVKYMEKAEELQQKCGLVDISPNFLKDVQKIYNLIDRGRDLASRELFDDSLKKYSDAIELSLKIMTDCDPKIRSEFFGEINDWMTEAEVVKKEAERVEKENPNSKPEANPVQEDVILAKEVTPLYVPEPEKPEWYLRLKDPNHQMPPSKWRYFVPRKHPKSPNDKDLNNADSESQQVVPQEDNNESNDPTCLLQ